MKYTLIYDPTAPFDGVRPSEADLARLSEQFNLMSFTGPLPAETTVLVNLHGKYFPKEWWKELSDGLKRGMGYLSFSAEAPLSRPVYRSGGEWYAERPQTAYHKRLMIQNSIPIERARQEQLRCNADFPVLAGSLQAFELTDTQGLIVQFTSADDHPGACGSSGPIDGDIVPLIQAVGANGAPVAACVEMIECFRGPMAGARHILINQNPSEAFWSHGGAEILGRLADLSAAGAVRFYPQPGYALYYPQEAPTLKLAYESLRGARDARLSLAVQKDGRTLWAQEQALRLEPEIGYEQLVLPFAVEAGFYRVEAALTVEGEPARRYRQGFWGYDAGLLASAGTVSCGRDYFLKDGKALPVVGMTYMQSDLHRKFLFLPNPCRWDEDFAEMKRAGINMVRTGVWTAYRQVMFIDGHPDEGVMRAFQAMVHTACRHDMPLVFCFFAFTPEQWEGVNCYLDPDSLRAQKRYIAAFLDRAENCGLVSWDLINEPSVCNPQRLWSSRPNGDAFELAAWRAYLRRVHGTAERLQERWNVSADACPDFESAPLPEEGCFNDDPTYAQAVNGFPAFDYHLFTMQVMNGWIREMSDFIRQKGNTQLVTVGQDESLPGKKPHPLLFSCCTDYVCNHSWWLMDGIYQDGVFAKPAGQPALIQETGIMYVANADGRARRSFHETRNILERKYGLAFGAGCAGAVHWLWNTNCQMDNLNEAHIGALLADGSQKAEADVSYDYGRFMRACAPYMGDLRPERVAVVLPFSNLFSVRNCAEQILVTVSRVLGYELKVPFQAVSEYELSTGMDYDVVIVPSPRILTDSCFAALSALAEKGAAIVLTGAYCQDEYFTTKTERLGRLSSTAEILPAQREEKLELDGAVYFASYSGDSLAFGDKAAPDGGGNAVVRVPSGKGQWIWCSLPLELNGNHALLRAFYSYALGCAGYVSDIEPEAFEPGVLLRKLKFSATGASLFVAVSENGVDTDIGFTDRETGRAYRFAVEAGRAALFLCDAGGAVLHAYRDLNIES